MGNSAPPDSDLVVKVAIGESSNLRSYNMAGLIGAQIPWVLQIVSIFAATQMPANLTPAKFADDVPKQLKPWLVQQTWRRDAEGPVLSLGQNGEFDDRHIFAPALAQIDDRYFLWYCGSRGKVASRVFRLGLATSHDGINFEKHPASPVLEFPDQRRSVLTPALLRSPNGKLLREDGQLRLWFSSTLFKDGSGLHTLHESYSDNGLDWSPPSKPLMENVYAPSIMRDGEHYRMWYVDVEPEAWIIRHAQSHDGREWNVTETPCLIVDQAWEQNRLFYPTVLKSGDVYLMWYGSYWRDRANTTATGFAVSLDGLKWYKHPDNPVLKPDPDRPWESHYVTSQSVLPTTGGHFRIWYASRKAPPFVNKYYAINTAIWEPRH